MSLLHEVAFERLLPKYERTFGGPPPFKIASNEEVVEHMRERLFGLPGSDVTLPGSPATLDIAEQSENRAARV